MKKAKQYWNDMEPVFKSGDLIKVKESVGVAMKGILLEIDEIVKMRNAKLNSAMVAIIKDQDKKWSSIVDKSEAAGFTWLNRDIISQYCISEGIVSSEDMIL